MSQLTLRYEYDASFFDPKLTRDDFGRLSVSATTDRFAARGGFWVQWQDVREFGEALVTFPITSDAPVVAQWGFDMQEGDDLILRIEIAPANSRGDLVVWFEIADDYEPRERARASFLTNYPDVEAFRSDIAKLMDRELDEAVLKGWRGRSSAITRLRVDRTHFVLCRAAGLPVRAASPLPLLPRL